jgi:hypothetical protein
MENNNVNDDDFTVESFEYFTVDKWHNLFDNHLIKDIHNNPYKCYRDFILVEFSKLEIMYFLENKSFSIKMIEKLKSILDGKDYFFKLSNRSPKDILEFNSIYEIDDDDHRTVKLQKKLKQLEVLKVNNINQIEYLLNNSTRTKEDIIAFSKYNGKTQLYLVFQDWKPNLGISVEYRCYVNKSKLVGISLFKPEYYSTRTVMPVEIIQHFTNQIIPIFDKINLNRYILDLFIYYDKPYEVQFMEINPFISESHTFSFEWDDINNSDTLLVTL